MTIHALLTGTLHKDPQSRTSANGKTFTTCQLRVEQDGSTTWASIIVFDQTAQDELSRLRAGDSVSIQGKAKLSVYQKGEEYRPSLDIVANSVTALRPKPRPKQPRQARQDSRQYDPRALHGAGGQRQAEPDFDDPCPI